MPLTRGRASDRVGKQSGLVAGVCENKDEGFMYFVNGSGRGESSISSLYLDLLHETRSVVCIHSTPCLSPRFVVGLRSSQTLARA